MVEDGYYFEMEGLPSGDPDDSLYPSAKKPSMVQFSSDPIRVRFCFGSKHSGEPG